MAEDQMPIRGTQFRTSRYPGFVSPNVTPAASAPSTDIPSDQPSYSPPSFAPEDFEAPDPTKEIGRQLAGAAGVYGATKFGEGVGSAIAQGAGFGEAAGAGLDKVGSSISSLFDFSGNAAASAAGGGAAGAAGGGAGGGLAGGAGGSTFGAGSASGAAGDVLGSVAGEAVGTAGSAASSAGASSLASQSFGGRLTSGATLGGAVGAGIGTAAVSLLMGAKPAEAAKQGIGAAAGFAIGNAILPGVGGFIGGAIGGMFCFAAGTEILMADGSVKKIEDLRLGDAVMLGGEVLGFGQAYADELYRYRGTMLTGSHAVFEGGLWLRAEDSDLAEPVEMPEGERVIVYPVVTQRHLLVTPAFISADLEEIDEAWNYNEAERIEILNGMGERNVKLRLWETEKLTQHVAA